MKSLDKSEGDFEEVASPHTYSSYICKIFYINLSRTVKDTELVPQLKWQILRIETREGKGHTAPAPGLYRNGQKKTQDFSRGMRRPQLDYGIFFIKMSL